MNMSKYLGLIFFLGACTTTQVERSGLQDGTFAAVSYDRDLDERDTTLRSVEESNADSGLYNPMRREFYLPNSYLKGLNKRAELARNKLNNQSSADSESLRVLAVAALVDGRPEQVQGFISLAKTKKARRNLAPEDQLLVGISKFMLGDTAGARAQLTELTGYASVAATARANLGLIAMKYGAHLEAMDMFRQAEAAEPKNSRLQHMLAESAHSARKHSLAVETYKKIISREPNDFLAHYNLGLVYHYGLRKYSDARREFLFVVDHPRSPRDMRVLADGAFTNVRREEEGLQGIATTGFQ